MLSNQTLLDVSHLGQSLAGRLGEVLLLEGEILQARQLGQGIGRGSRVLRFFGQVLPQIANVANRGPCVANLVAKTIQIRQQVACFPGLAAGADQLLHIAFHLGHLTLHLADLGKHRLSDDDIDRNEPQYDSHQKESPDQCILLDRRRMRFAACKFRNVACGIQGENLRKFHGSRKIG